MAGHSQFANIKHRKDAQDRKRAQLFTKLVREIIVAVSTGQKDPAFNPRLRVALAAARKAGVTKDRIENAIKKGAGEIESERYEEIRYEAYGPGGVALIIEGVTDNRNRSASEVRSTLTKNGGTLGESGSVNFMFDRLGIIRYPASVASADVVFEAALEAGASNCESDSTRHEVSTVADDFSHVRDQLVQKFGDPEEAAIVWRAKDPMVLDQEEKARQILELLEELEALDDVKAVIANIAISDAVAHKLNAS